MLTEQEPPERVQGPPGVKVTVPIGVTAPVPDVSATVAVHDVAWPATTVLGLHETEVEVVRRVTARENTGELVLLP